MLNARSNMLMTPARPTAHGTGKRDGGVAAYELLSASLYIENDIKDVAALFLACSSLNGLEKHTITHPTAAQELPPLQDPDYDPLIKINHGGG